MALTGSGGEGPLPHCLVVCVLCLFLLFGLCLCWFVYTPVCFFGWSWAQHPNLHFVGGAGLITLTNTFLVELGSTPWYRLGPTPQLPCSLAPSMRGQAKAPREEPAQHLRLMLHRHDCNCQHLLAATLVIELVKWASNLEGPRPKHKGACHPLLS